MLSITSSEIYLTYAVLPLVAPPLPATKAKIFQTCRAPIALRSQAAIALTTRGTPVPAASSNPVITTGYVLLHNVIQINIF
jgi:hypothetical protein